MKDSGALAIWRLRGYWGVSIRGTSCVVPQSVDQRPHVRYEHSIVCNCYYPAEPLPTWLSTRASFKAVPISDHSRNMGYRLTGSRGNGGNPLKP